MCKKYNKEKLNQSSNNSNNNNNICKNKNLNNILVHENCNF